MNQTAQYVLKEIKEWVLTFWTMIQSTLGLILIGITWAEEVDFKVKDKTYKIYIARYLNSFWSGVSLGEYIVFAKKDYVDEISVRHEYGHHIQSLILGPLYLLLIGIPSVLGNVWDRIAHRKWSYWKREQWYYTQPWEQWADEFGGITLSDRGINDR